MQTSAEKSGTLTATIPHRVLPPLTEIEAEIARQKALIARANWLERVEETREKCKTLVGFMREAWHVLEPTKPYVHGWHHDAVGAHLEAITRGELFRCGINEPPGSMKSLEASVFWQAWEWGPQKLPGLRYLTTSYTEKYSRRDSRKTRDLIMSEWYRAHWPHVILERDNEIDFENTYKGTRTAMPFKSLTGGRGNRLIIDDPHSTEQAESDTERETATRVFRESVPSRLNDPAKDAILIIMHRLHPRDVCGVAEALGLGYTFVKIPMEYERATHFSTHWYSDPRTQEGELLMPDREPRENIEKTKIALGSHAYATQYQQKAKAREGGLFKRHWFVDKYVDGAPPGTKWVRHWDLAASRATGSANQARTAGVKIGRAPDGRFFVGNVVRILEEGLEVRQTIKATAESDGRGCEISLPQDPGQAGKVQAKDLIAMLAGFIARAEPETGSKETRAEPFSVQCEAGNVYIVRGTWNEAYLDELADFPSGTKDQVDGSSGAFARLIGKKTMVISDQALAWATGRA